MRISLTGATGFAGRQILSHLLAAGHEVRAWYRGETKPSTEGVVWVPGNLEDETAASRLVEGCEGVIHAALARSGRGFMQAPKDPVAYFQTNVIGSLRLIDAAEKAGAGRFIFLSSGAVHEKTADDLPLDERHPLWPASLYGAGKASVETLVHAYGFSKRLPTATLRPVSIVGVETPVANSKWYDLIVSMMRNETVDISGGGKIVLVEDVARAVQLLLNTDAPIAGQTYNCAAGFYSTDTIATLIREITASRSETTGQAKTTARQMETEKIENLGMRFGGPTEIRQLLERLVSLVRFDHQP